MTRTNPFLLGSDLLILACAAHGQGEPAATASAAASRVLLEEIIVTARRRAESLQDVPQVVNAVNTETIEKLNFTRFEAIASIASRLVQDYNPIPTGSTRPHRSAV
jgi:iron complex outermembrane receptor protein